MDGVIRKETVGYIETCHPLGAGAYVLVEIQAPEGYTKSRPVAFEVYGDSVHYYAEPEKIALVPNTSFIPSPEVDSEVIKLNIRKSPPVKIDNEKLFFNVIKASFMQRRKTLSNGLVNGGIVKNKAKAIEILKNMGLEENVRGEELTLEQFANLSNKIN